MRFAEVAETAKIDTAEASEIVAAPGARIEALPDTMFVIDEDGTILDCVGGDPRDLAFPRERLIGRRVTRCPFGDIGQRFAAAMEAARGSRKPISIEYILPCDNNLASFEARLTSSDGGRFVALVRNMSQHAEARSAVRRSERETRSSMTQLRAAFDAAADGILVVDPKGNFVTCNALFGEMWSVPQELLQPGQEKEIAVLVLAQFADSGSLVEELMTIHRSDRDRCKKVLQRNDGRFFECVSRPKLIEGEQIGRVWSFRDVTDQMQTEERFRHHAYHDSLTGLPNRTLFHDRLRQGLGQSRRATRNTALLLIDLDRFKTINDTLGHAAGDRLLVEVGKRLESRKREGDTIARLGGDEFVFLVSEMRYKEDAAVVAEHILDVLKPPIQIDEHELYISASIGIAVFPDDGDEGVSLMKSADVALYRAKDLGRNNYQIYEPKLSQRAMERLVMEKDLRRAIHNQEFILYYQPQYDLKTGQMRGVEALIRWVQDGVGRAAGQVHSNRGRVWPGRSAGPLGARDSLRRQCVDIQPSTVRDPLRVCVNLSALQIQRPNFANEVSEIMQDAGSSVEASRAGVDRKRLDGESRAGLLGHGTAGADGRRHRHGRLRHGPFFAQPRVASTDLDDQDRQVVHQPLRDAQDRRVHSDGHRLDGPRPGHEGTGGGRRDPGPGRRASGTGLRRGSGLPVQPSGFRRAPDGTDARPAVLTDLVGCFVAHARPLSGCGFALPLQLHLEKPRLRAYLMENRL